MDQGPVRRLGLAPSLYGQILLRLFYGLHTLIYQESF